VNDDAVDKKSVVEALLTVLQHSLTHFADEENFMKHYRYPLMTEHVDAHKNMIRRLMQCILNLEV
jgi:hemerythrin